MRPAILITRPRRLSCRRCAESARPKRLLTPCKIGRTGERDNAIAHPLRIGDVSLAGRDVPTYRPLNNDTMKTMIALFFPQDHYFREQKSTKSLFSLYRCTASRPAKVVVVWSPRTLCGDRGD